MVEKIVHKFLENQAISVTKKAEVEYVLTIWVEKIITYILLSALLLFVGKFFEGMVFFVSFLLIRQTTGGFHMKSFGGCLCGTILTVFCCVTYMPWIHVNSATCYITLWIISVIYILVSKPVNHPNMCFSPEELKKLKFFNVCVTVSECILVITGLLMGQNWSIYIINAMIVCAGLIIVAKIAGQELK